MTSVSYFLPLVYNLNNIKELNSSEVTGGQGFEILPGDRLGFPVNGTHFYAGNCHIQTDTLSF